MCGLTDSAGDPAGDPKDSSDDVLWVHKTNTAYDDLRGAIMPVIDLRNRLGLGVTIPETRHVIVVVECQDRLAGILVDAVSETFTVPRDSLQPAPDVGVEELRYIQAIISMENRLITYLRMDDVFPAVVHETA